MKTTQLWTRSLGAVLIPCLALSALAACHSAEEPKGAGPTPVRVRALAPEANAGRGASRFSATVEPDKKVDLSFKVGGYVQRLAEVKTAKGTRTIQEGDWVDKGTVLAVIQQDDYGARAAGAQASVAEATASLKQAQLDYDRMSKLLAARAVPQADVDNAKAKLEVTEAQVKAARAHLGEASVSLADTTLKAPFSGVVLRRSVEVGQLASPGTPGFVLADTRTMKVVFGAPDAMLKKLHMGDEVAIRIEALGKALTGTISRIAPSADSKSRAFDVQASIANQDDQVKVGMIASLAIGDAATSAEVLPLPLTAVVRSPNDPRGFAVYVVQGAPGNETAHLREVKLGEVTGNAVVVTDGLKPGERVIESGSTLVTDNHPVRVVR